jgi:hypothetical protein
LLAIGNYGDPVASGAETALDNNRVALVFSERLRVFEFGNNNIRRNTNPECFSGYRQQRLIDAAPIVMRIAERFSNQSR